MVSFLLKVTAAAFPNFKSPEEDSSSDKFHVGRFPP
jgi:hypothetical protein